MIADAIEEVHRQQKDVIGVDAAYNCSDRLYDDGVRRKVVGSSASKDTLGPLPSSSGIGISSGVSVGGGSVRGAPSGVITHSSASSRFHNSPDPYPFRRHLSPQHSESQSTSNMRSMGLGSSKAQALRRAAVASARLHDEAARRA